MENRERTPGSYDKDASDSGLVVWRVDETRFSSGPTSLVSPRPGAGSEAWDPSDPETPQRTVTTTWADGTAAAVAIRAIGARGARIRAYFDVPGPGVLVDTYGLRAAPVARGATSPLPIAVRNTGEAADTFDVTIVGLPAGWTTSTRATTLGAQETADVPVLLTLPATASAGVHTLTANGQSRTDPAVRSTASLRVRVRGDPRGGGRPARPTAGMDQDWTAVGRHGFRVPLVERDRPAVTLCRPGRQTWSLAGVTAVSPIPRTSPTVVGRDPEIARLAALLAGGGTLTLVGEAGMGKTRLARHAAEMGESAGWSALTGRAGTLDGDISLAPLRDALRARQRQASGAPPPADALAAAFPAMVLPELRAGTAAEEPGRDVVFEAAARWVAAAAGRTGLLLVLEDLHWADVSTHQLVHHLARVTAGTPVAIVLTFRPHEAEQGSSLDDLRRDLARDRLADELHLGPLTPEAVGALLRGIVGADLAPALVARFAEMGGGNPFVTEELLRAAIEGGSFAPREGVWRAELPLDLPWSVSEMVLTRVRRLDPADQDLLGWAAVAGERFDPEMLLRAADLDERAGLDGLARGKAAGLLRDDDAGRMAFRHALTHEAVLGSLLGPERRRRHARLLAAGEALAAEGRDVPLGLLLGHAIGAGDRRSAFRYARDAAARSLEVGGQAEALAQTERAIEAWSEAEGHEARAELMLQRGRLLHWVAHDHARAADALAEAAGGFRTLGLVDRAALADALGAGARWWAGDPAALDDLRAARRGLSPAAPPELRLEVLNEIARPLMLDGYPREAAAIAEAGLALLPTVRTPRAIHERVDLQTTLGTCRVILGDFSAGAATLADSARTAIEGRDPVGACRALHNVAFAVEDLATMEGHARRGLAVAREHGLRPSERSFLIALAAREAWGGRFDSAERLCADAEAVVGPWEGLAHTRLDVGLPRAFLALARGQVEEALAAFAAVVERLRGARESGTWTAQRGLALARLAAGDLPGARAALAPALATDEPSNYDRVLALGAAAEVAAVEGDRAEAERLAEELARVAPAHPGAAAARALAAALAARPGATAEVEEVAAAHGRAGRRVAGARWRLLAAEALAHGGAPGAADVAARARAEFAAMGAEGWCRRAERLLRRLGRRVPGRPSGPGAGTLTAREVEVVRLLSEGLSNRAIAERLVISQKTAGRHVANAYTKLGVHTRVEAARAAMERGLLDPPDVPPATA